VIQRTLTMTWKVFSTNSFRAVLRDHHSSYVWKVKILQPPSTYYDNWCPAEMDKPGKPCTDLISKTASSLSNSVVTLMLLAVQKDNLELNIKYAVEWLVPIYNKMRMK
jgi:hypothetical protein